MTAETTEEKQRGNPFKPGQSGNPAGRPKGSRNKLQTDFLKALAEDFEKDGIAAIREMREKDPSAYIKTVAGLMPKQLEIERPLQEMTDDDLINAVAALQSFLAAQGTGEGANATASGESATSIQALH